MLFDEFIVAIDVIRTSQVPSHRNIYVITFGGSGLLAGNSSDAPLSEDLVAHNALCRAVFQELQHRQTFRFRSHVQCPPDLSPSSSQALPNLDNRLVNLGYRVSGITNAKHDVTWPMLSGDAVLTLSTNTIIGWCSLHESGGADIPLSLLASLLLWLLLWPGHGPDSSSNTSSRLQHMKASLLEDWPKSYRDGNLAFALDLLGSRSQSD